MTAKMKILSFYLNNHHLGIDITAVKEINRNVTYTPIPDAPPHIVGLFNMRGQVVTLFDLARLLGHAKPGTGARTTSIILKNRAETPDYAGFLIDQPGAVIDVNPEDLEPPPANIVQPELITIDKVIKLDGDSVMVIKFSPLELATGSYR